MYDTWLLALLTNRGEAHSIPTDPFPTCFLEVCHGEDCYSKLCAFFESTAGFHPCSNHLSIWVHTDRHSRVPSTAVYLALMGIWIHWACCEKDIGDVENRSHSFCIMCKGFGYRYLDSCRPGPPEQKPWGHWTQLGNPNAMFTAGPVPGAPGPGRVSCINDMCWYRTNNIGDPMGISW